MKTVTLFIHRDENSFMFIHRNENIYIFIHKGKKKLHFSSIEVKTVIVSSIRVKTITHLVIQGKKHEIDFFINDFYLYMYKFLCKI